jgi:FHS family L-fucose permease-like MFS transporter
MMKEEATRNYKGAFALLTLLFFMWGFITVTNDLLIATFRSIFSLTAFQSSLVQFSFFGAYFVISLIYFLISLFAGDPINRIGYKAGMIIGLLGAGLGCALFYPAAQLASYGFFLVALFVLAAGVTILQIAANPYAAIMGSPESASGRLNFAQGFNSLGTTLGPLVGAILIFKVFSTGAQSPKAVAAAYLVYAGLFVLCALLVAVSSMPPFRNEEKTANGFSLGALRHPQLILGMVAIFLYVGAEVSAGSFLLDFLKEPTVLGLPKESATRLLSFYWGGLMIGRLLGAISLSTTLSNQMKTIFMGLVSIACFVFIYFVTGINTEAGAFTYRTLPIRELSIYMLLLVVNYAGMLLGRNAPARAIWIFSLVIIALLLTGALGSGNVAAWSVIGVGLFNSIMWSNIFSLSIHGLGRDTSQGSSLLIMAVVGGALIPPLQAILADSTHSFQLSYLVPAVCYLYLAFYGWWVQTSKAGSHKAVFNEK